MNPARFERRLVLLLAVACLACAPAGREGEPIGIADESAIILWDSARKTQHFIRRASFNTDAKDFGFLVPTPAKPVLAEAPDAAFTYLAKVTAPKTVWRFRFRDDTLAMAGIEAKKSEKNVKVLEEKKVAGYDAAVLEANDAEALGAWLKKNGYVSTPALVEWFKPYIARKWVITAFKISKDASGEAKAKAVRMSFATDRPFFPYSEPRPAKGDEPVERTLRIFFLGDARRDGTIGDKQAWTAEQVWSGTLSEDESGGLLKLLSLAMPETGMTRHLTEFLDRARVRSGEGDLYFDVSKDQSTIRRPDEIRWIGPFEIAATLIIAGILAGILYLPARWMGRKVSRLVRN